MLRPYRLCWTLLYDWFSYNYALARQPISKLLETSSSHQLAPRSSGRPLRLSPRAACASCASNAGWVDPAQGGGALLSSVDDGLCEPINAIVSAASDPEIMTDQGFKKYMLSLGFAFECLGQHLGGHQYANLGDGNGYQKEHVLLRSVLSHSDPAELVGTCAESLFGGNHFRAWRQNGTCCDTGAWFLAVSVEEDLEHAHTISSDGYNRGRDGLVSAAVRGSAWRGSRWQANVAYAELLQSGYQGINHGIGQDGRVAVLTVEKDAKLQSQSVQSLRTMQ